MVELHLDAEARAKQLRIRENQLRFSSDDIADEIRQAAIRERHIRAALENRDLTRLIQTPQPRRATRPAGDSADDQNFFLFHDELEWPGAKPESTRAKTSVRP